MLASSEPHFVNGSISWFYTIFATLSSRALPHLPELLLTITQALLTYIQAHQGSASEKGEAFIRLQTLADDKEERITDIDDLEIYEYAAKELAKGGRSDELSEFVCKIRLLAVKKIPTDERFATACLKKCVNDGKFDIALQVRLPSFLIRLILPPHHANKGIDLYVAGEELPQK